MVPCHYEINVSLNGRHFFATAERSLQFSGLSGTKEMYKLFKAKFPESEGYEISVTYIDCSGRGIDTSGQDWQN